MPKMPTPAQGQRQNTATSTPQPRAVDQEMHLPPGSVWGSTDQFDLWTDPSGSRASVATTSSSASSVVNGPATSSGKGGKSGKDKASGSTSREKKGVDKVQKADKGGAENVENNGSCGTILSTSSKTAKVPSWSTKGNKDKQEGVFLDKNSPSTLTPPAPPPPVPSSTPPPLPAVPESGLPDVAVASSSCGVPSLHASKRTVSNSAGSVPPPPPYSNPSSSVASTSPVDSIGAPPPAMALPAQPGPGGGGGAPNVNVAQSQSQTSPAAMGGSSGSLPLPSSNSKKGGSNMPPPVAVPAIPPPNINLSKGGPPMATATPSSDGGAVPPLAPTVAPPPGLSPPLAHQTSKGAGATSSSSNNAGSSTAQHLQPPSMPPTMAPGGAGADTATTKNASLQAGGATSSTSARSKEKNKEPLEKQQTTGAPVVEHSSEADGEGGPFAGGSRVDSKMSADATPFIPTMATMAVSGVPAAPPAVYSEPVAVVPPPHPAPPASYLGGGLTPASASGGGKGWAQDGKQGAVPWEDPALGKGSYTPASTTPHNGFGAAPWAPPAPAVVPGASGPGDALANGYHNHPHPRAADTATPSHYDTDPHSAIDGAPVVPPPTGPKGGLLPGKKGPGGVVAPGACQGGPPSHSRFTPPGRASTSAEEDPLVPTPYGPGAAQAASSSKGGPWAIDTSAKALEPAAVKGGVAGGKMPWAAQGGQMASYSPPSGTSDVFKGEKGYTPASSSSGKKGPSSSAGGMVPGGTPVSTGGGPMGSSASSTPLGSSAVLVGKKGAAGALTGKKMGPPVRNSGGQPPSRPSQVDSDAGTASNPRPDRRASGLEQQLPSASSVGSHPQLDRRSSESCSTPTGGLAQHDEHDVVKPQVPPLSEDPTEDRHGRKVDLAEAKMVKVPSLGDQVPHQQPLPTAPSAGQGAGEQPHLSCVEDENDLIYLREKLDYNIVGPVNAADLDRYPRIENWLLSQKVFGLDMKHNVEGRDDDYSYTALLIFAAPANNSDPAKVLLLRTHECHQLPDSVVQVMMSRSTVKALVGGTNVHISRCQKSFGIGLACVKDPSEVAKEYEGIGKMHQGTRELSLRQLCRVFNLTCITDKRIQTSDWEKPRLSPAQIRCAADDGWCSLQSWLKLEEARRSKHVENQRRNNQRGLDHALRDQRQNSQRSSNGSSQQQPGSGNAPQQLQQGPLGGGGIPGTLPASANYHGNGDHLHAHHLRGGGAPGMGAPMLGGPPIGPPMGGPMGMHHPMHYAYQEPHLPHQQYDPYMMNGGGY